MPQARRKNPFSGKAKKQQLQSKKQNKTMLMPSSDTSTGYDVVSVNYQPSRSKGRDTNRYALKFYRESDHEVALKKEEALKELNPVPPKDMEISPSDYFPAELSFPKRPHWDFNMTPAQLDAQEQRYFKNYIDTLQSSPHWKDMSYFELNLETWRQLWRVLEMCDILLLIVDVRFAGMMFPPSLYEYVIQQKKDMILVLNKIDLVPASVVLAWQQFLTDTCPGLKVVHFTSCPGYNLRGTTSDKAGLQIRRRKGRQRMCLEGATQILDACKSIVQDKVDLSSWEKKIKEESNLEVDEESTAVGMCLEGATQILDACKSIVQDKVDLSSWEKKIKEESNLEVDEESTAVGQTIFEKPDTSFYTHEKFKSGVLTIGCVGQPNVGKSSLLNSVMGRCVVSVSKTPGHTKHFQTIFLTPQVRLCDCPGLVFPSTVPRPIQILMGSYPIAQLREPYTTIRYLAERLDLPTLLRMSHPEGDSSWSPRDICDGWAKKRGYLTAKAARLDTYRAGNSLLRMALDGKICLYLRPPGYTENIEKYENSEEIKYIKWVQALTNLDQDQKVDDIASDSDKSGDDDEEDEDEESNDDTTVMANKFAALGGDD